ncbi:MAG: hypothetical protein JXM68_02430, partial [Sedimentisphaerales bacterium]|nr:hypothetical protein [Sedimentisphaerales bacterium]
MLRVVAVLMLLTSSLLSALKYEPFVIKIVDAKSGVPVPLVELKTVNAIKYYSDVNGEVAFFEPDLMDQEVFFHIKSRWFDFPKDGFGYAGKRFQVSPGGRELLSVDIAAPEPIYNWHSLPGKFYKLWKSLSGREVYALFNRAYIPASKTIEPYIIKVSDSQTQRGVPLVRLIADNGMEFYTDSAGIIAIYEPGFFGRNISFRVSSHGYTSPAGECTVLPVEKGGSATIKLDRINLARRIYRITGQGIYNDSILAGLRNFDPESALPGRVMGQDTVAKTIYNGKYHWLWGDTQRPEYPLGHFKTAGATSSLPDNDVLSPGDGIALTYFTDNTGFSKQMYPADVSLVWMGTLTTVSTEQGEKMVGSYSFMVGKDSNVTERGFAVFNDQIAQYESIVIFNEQHNIIPMGLCSKHEGYIYVNCPYPTIRIKASLQAVKDPWCYEAYTPLATGTKFEGDNTLLDRKADGSLNWSWKKNTAPLTDQQWHKLITAGLVKQDDTWNWITDHEVNH